MFKWTVFTFQSEAREAGNGTDTVNMVSTVSTDCTVSRGSQGLTSML